MNQDLMTFLFSAMVNQAITNQSNNVNLLPSDQQKVQDNILRAIHDLIENKQKIRPEYDAQIRDAAILKLATEIGWFNGGQR